MSEVQPAASREALNAQQFGTTAAQYVASAVHAGGDDLRQIAEIAKSVAGGRVIDLGCGGGHVSYAVAPHVDSVVAYDLSAEMVAAVAAEAARRGLSNITTAQGPAEALPFGDASFDAVFCRYTAHHWPDVRRGLREARRVLKPGGIAVFADIVAPELPVLDTFLQTFEMLRDPSHVRDYSMAEWVEFATQAGFMVTGVTRRRLPLDFASWVARQRTPEVQVKAIRALFAAVSSDVRAHFDVRENDDFTIDSVVFELRSL
ncbi:MAG: methyltransferase domain-containing protein [Devosia sp.]|nr:methyltransferase domain-containing protein [Devosia sp.]